MNRRTKLLSVVLLSLALVLAACSSGSPGGEASEPKKSKESVTSPSASTEPEKPLKLSIMVTSWGPAVTKDNPLLLELEKRTNTDLDVTMIPFAEYNDRFNVTLASGSIPDIVNYISPPGQLLSSNIVQGIQGGMFHDLTEYIEDPEFDSKYPNLAKIPKGVWQYAKYNGKNYVLPRNLSPVSFMGLWLRKDIFDASGQKIPKTIEEFTDLIMQLDNPPEMYGLHFQGKNAMDGSNMKAFANAFTGFRDWRINEAGEFEYQAFVSEYKDFLTWLKKLYDAKVIDPEFPLGQGASEFGKGKSVAINHTWQTFIQSPNFNLLKDAGPDATSLLLSPLQGPKGHAIDFSPGFGYPALVSSKLPKEDIPRLLEFWDYTASPEHKEFTTWGIKDVHYTEENGKKVLNTEKAEADALGSISMLMWSPTRDFIQEHRNYGASEEILSHVESVAKEVNRVYEEDYANDPFPVFNLNAPAYASKWANLTKDLDDNRVKVVVGVMSIEQWDQYVASITSSSDYKQIVAEFKAARQ